MTEIDFSRIPASGIPLLTLFKAKPAFYEKDFLEIVRRLYASAATTANSLLQTPVMPEPDEEAFRWEEEERLQMVFDSNLLPKTVSLWDKKGKPRLLKDFRLENLVERLLHWERDSLRRPHASTLALLEIFHFSLAAAKKGAIVPELFECSPGRFRIRWLPSLVVPEVREMFESIVDYLPTGLLTVESNEGESGLSPTETLQALCSFFIGFCVKTATLEDSNPLPKMFHSSNETEPVEFGKSQKIDIWALRPGRRSAKVQEAPKPAPTPRKAPPDIPQLLRYWLQPFFPSEKNHILLAIVQDSGTSFSLEFGVEFRSEPQMPAVSLSQLFKEKKYEALQADILPNPECLAGIFPKLSPLLLESKSVHRMVFNEMQFREVLLTILPALELTGVRLQLPEGLYKPVHPRTSLLGKKTDVDSEGTFIHPESLFTLEWQVALGERRMQVGEFAQSVINLNGIVKIEGQYVLVEEDDLIQLFRQLESPPPRLQGSELLRALLEEEWEGIKITLDEAAGTLLQQFKEPPETPLPKGLKAKLRPYQLSGYDWLMKNARLGFGSLLADDLGLGKNLQVIAALLQFKEEGYLDKKKALIIAPASLLVHWRREIQRVAPSLVPAIYYGNKRPLGVHNPHVILTSYSVAHSELELLKKLDWHCCVADEAQRFKKADTQLVKSIKSLAAPLRIALCSRLRPDNSLVWSIMDFTNPGYFNSQQSFEGAYILPIRREHDRQRWELLRKMTAPFILRRRKTDKSILPDMRELGDHDLCAALSPTQETAYLALVQQHSKGILEEKEGARRRSLVLKMVHALRQVCNHPALLSKKEIALPEQSGKIALLFALLDNIYEQGEKVLIYTQYQETGELMAQLISANYEREPLFLHDLTLRPSRDKILQAFQHSVSADTLIYSLHGGGSGMSLHAASHFIHFDLWCNPALESQALERALAPAHRRKAMVWRLMTQGVFEEKTDEWIQSEPDFQRLTAADGENWLGNLTNGELMDLVKVG